MKEGKKFEFPEAHTFAKSQNLLGERQVTCIQSNVGFAVYSFQMAFKDTETPQFGQDLMNLK